jgi:hypothetical protein
MKDFFAKDFVIGFFISFHYLPASPITNDREGVLTRDLMAAQSGKTIFTEGDILPGQSEDLCPVNMVAFEGNLFGLVRVSNLLAGLSVIKEELKFCGVLAISHIAWFDSSNRKWTTEYPPDEQLPFDRHIESLKTWPRPVSLETIKTIPGNVSLLTGPRLLREFFDFLDSGRPEK